MESVAVFMIKKIVGVSVSIFLLCMLAPSFFIHAYVYVDQVNNYVAYVDNDTGDVSVVDLEEQLQEQEPEPEQVAEVSDVPEETTTMVTTITIDKIAEAAVADIVAVLDEKLIVYDEQLHDDLYVVMQPYLREDNTEYVVEVVREDVHDVILANVSPESTSLYAEENVEKYVDKVFDDIYVVSVDNQDSEFLTLVLIVLVASILVCAFFSYFIM